MKVNIAVNRLTPFDCLVLGMDDFQVFMTDGAWCLSRIFTGMY